MADVSIGWVAGFVDGEGCFLIQKTVSGLNAAVIVQQTCIEPLDYMKEVLGVGIVKPVAKRPNQSDVWRWAVTDRDSIIYVCETLIPHLKVKRADAELVSEFARTMGAVGTRLTEERRAVRLAVYDRYLALRGREV